jgi:putative membrane protein
VILLRWLLKEKSRPTLIVLSGLMLGSLRALWPWQDDERNLMPVGEFIWQSLSLFIIGAAVVWLLVKLEKQLANE